VGDRVARRTARQHPDLTDVTTGAGRSTGSVFRVILFTLLAIDGVVSAVIGAFFLPVWLFGIPFPVSALLSGLLNAALVWVGLQWTSSTKLAAIPLWTWFLTVLVLMFGGPGSDNVLGSRGLSEFGPLVLLVLGVGPAVFLLRRQLAPPVVPRTR